MNTTDFEIMSENRSHIARITRRSFIKRTSGTILVTALALHSFRIEAIAADAGGSSSPRFPMHIGDRFSPDTFSADDEIREDLAGGGKRHHKIEGSYRLHPESVDEQLALAKKKTCSVQIEASHLYSDDGDATWTTASTIDMEIELTGENPQYPNQAKPVWTANGADQQVWGNGDTTLTSGANVEISAGDMRIQFTIYAYIGVVPGFSDAIVIGNMGNFADGPSPDLSVEHYEEVRVAKLIELKVEMREKRVM